MQSPGRRRIPATPGTTTQNTTRTTARNLSMAIFFDAGRAICEAPLQTVGANDSKWFPRVDTPSGEVIQIVGRKQ